MTQKEFDRVVRITRVIDASFDFVQALKALDEEDYDTTIAILGNTYSEMTSKALPTARKG